MKKTTTATNIYAPELNYFRVDTRKKKQVSFTRIVHYAMAAVTGTYVGLFITWLIFAAPELLK